MDRDKMRGYLTDRLCGELGEREAEQIEVYILAHPEFRAEVEKLEEVWDQLEGLYAEGRDDPRWTEKMYRKFKELLEGRLSEAELDWVAGGTASYPDDFEKDPNSGGQL